MKRYDKWMVNKLDTGMKFSRRRRSSPHLCKAGRVKAIRRSFACKLYSRKIGAILFRLAR